MNKKNSVKKESKTKKSPNAKKSSSVKKSTKSKKVNTKKTNGSKKSEKKSNFESKLIYEVKLILLIGFTVISVFSLHTFAMGIVGETIKKIYLGLFSKTAYIVPYVVFFIIFFIINNNLKTVRKKYIFSILLGFFSILAIYSNLIYDISMEGYKLTNIKVLSIDGVITAFNYGVIGTSSGSIGTLLSYALVGLFGKIGTYVVSLILLFIAIVIGTKISIVDIFNSQKKFATNVVTNANRQYKEKKAVSKENIKQNIEEIKQKKTEKFSDFDSNNYVLDKNIEKTSTSVSLPSNAVNTSSEESMSIKINAFDDEVKSNVVSEPSTASSINNNEMNKSGETQNVQVKTNKEIKKENSKISKKEVKKIENDLEKASHMEYENYIIPSVKMLSNSKVTGTSNKKEILDIARKLESILASFKVEAKVVQISKGPAITMFELQPSPGVKVSKIVNLSDDIALGLAAQQIRIIAPIPGKAAVGIEIPNKNTSLVTLKDVLDTKEFRDSKSKLSFALGKDISGNSIVSDLSKMPHLLIAGATGSGKSVCVNTLIASILFNARPDEVKLLMIDPKVVELNNYNGIPHLILPVVTDPKKASIALNWAVQEMTNRYNTFAETSVRDINSYNKKAEKNDLEKMPKIVVIIDELADLMMVAPNQVEDAICRLAQMARAAGIHLIVATQRPSVDVITGLIKANIPSRIAFSVSSQIDSRTILDMGGAEKLLGKGDMLFSPVGLSKPMRVQGAFVSDEEVENLVAFVKGQSGQVNYDEGILENTSSTLFIDNNDDEYLRPSIEHVINSKQASVSMLQRKFRIGYNRAARIVDEMEERGIVGPSAGSKPREVLVGPSFLEEDSSGENLNTTSENL
ncbi:DNA translocase FtsK [Helicovermis profundi]|uniref:DNA translocase FtsK n=1 Tax=Helicovermis profundi TaxID=3065157 RepID=A0AAU9ED74_9FIRM|nr:DNA translocase FtsK [Clostridia bacterium S502]